jgi:phospholipase/lecithinase/hemolysin
MHLTTTHARSRSGLSLLCALFLLLLPLSALAGDFTGLVTFGDSLSDPGNHFIAFGLTARQPFMPIPDASYAIGGHHFSNGATWAEQLATKLGLPTSGHPALRVPGKFTNYAVGRARARAGSPVFAHYDLGTQVGLFLSDFGGHASPGHLYAVEIGTNDLNDALSALAGDPSGATSMAILEEALTAVAQNIYVLWVSGARTFLVLNVPDLTITPVGRTLGPEAQFVVALLTNAYNGALAQTLTGLGALPEIRFVQLDLNALFATVVAAPDEVGLTNAQDACLTFGVVGGAICATPNRYLFWDGIHPTETGHDIIADAAHRALVEGGL